MSISLKIESESKRTPIALTNGQISEFSFKHKTPTDSWAKSTEASHTLYIRGKAPLRLFPSVAANSNNSDMLYTWALSNAGIDEDYYRKCTILIIRNEQTIRKVIFPHAFVHCYTEQIDGREGTIRFELVLGQKRDQLDKVEVDPNLKETNAVKIMSSKTKEDPLVKYGYNTSIPMLLSTATTASTNKAKAIKDTSGNWCRATVKGKVYSHAAPCSDPKHCIMMPADLQNILDKPSARIEYVSKFFEKYQGKHYPNPSTQDIKINYGIDIIGFMKWEEQSQRFTDSPYWQYVNAQMIADIYWAQGSFIVAKNTKTEEIWSENEIKWRKFKTTPNQDLLWKAHNGSIFSGHKLAVSEGYLEKETAAEQQFIKNVIFRVSLMEKEVNEIVDVPSNLGTINYLMDSKTFEYPKDYPATFDDAATKPFWEVEEWVPQYLIDKAPK
ncbi:hypothetical protein [Paenibacillus sp. Leaf72]|uniref:hypothetical protein n=1 Tax=Paenibacillus sp. Leaf72 TaxID=1736234 RepID=UPI0006F9C9A6|nr:hypothetical protein [Paenibacillus sp. Leaf72]KQO18105.1 hypothetical protein ASF12_05550 [Paenibacillus sp. Leaf72]